MTVPPDHDPQRHDHRPAPSDDLPPATRDDAPRVAAAVPIAVWRLDDRDDSPPTTELDRGFASRLATQLVLIYTSRSQTVIDLDNDPYLRHAATTAGRTYLAATDLAGLADLDPLVPQVSLIALRWPRTSTPGTAHQLADLFAACRQMMCGDTSLVAAVRPADPDEPGPTFADHEHALHAASEAVGLTHVLQIVAIAAPGEGDQFVYYATEAEAGRVAAAATIQGGQVLHIDLLVFAMRVGRRG
jgi:hypothetical protein